MPISVVSASMSAALKAVSPRISGKPRARHSRRAWSTVTPVSAATSRALKLGAWPRIASSRRSPARRAGSSSGTAQAPSSRRSPSERPCSSWATWQLHVLHAGDVVELDPAVGAGVGDDEGAAAEDPVDHPDLEVDAADPVQRDRPPLLGDEARALDEAAVGERVGRGEPRDQRTHHPPHDDTRGDRRRSRHPPRWSRSASRRTARRLRRTTRTSTGTISALGWVRVETTTCSPSLRSLVGKATGRSCHPVGRTCTTSPAATVNAPSSVPTTRAPRAVDVERLAPAYVPARQVDVHASGRG